jgi:hypothetical protein
LAPFYYWDEQSYALRYKNLCKIFLPLSNCTCCSFFFANYTSTKRRHLTRKRTHLCEYRYINPTPWAHPKRFAGTSRDWRSHHRRLAVDRNVAYHWKHIAVKSWNKFRKMRAFMPSRELKPGWAGSTIKNLTNWARLSSHMLQF